ncbi:P-loop containing nucleoside triphosphate hydrolase protein [Elaphomyces granulatus]
MNFTNEESLPDMNYADSFYQKRVLSGSDYETESQESETDSEIHRAVGIEDTAKNRSAPKAEVSQNVPGSKCEVKFLYNHSSISRGPGSIWSENADLILEEDRLKALAAPYAIVHRFSKSKGRKKNGALAWETHSIEIQSNKLKAFLDTIFEDYRDWDPDTEPYTFRPPFREVFHRWEALKLKYAQQPDESVRDEVKMLIDIFLPFMTPHRTALEEIERTETISFSQLWLIFPPGELVVALIEGNMCVCRLRKLAIGQKYLTLTMEQFDWNGRYCGFKDTLVELFAYPELKPMSKLRPYPLRFASNKEIQTKLLARGRQFAALRGFHVRKCVGEKYVSLRKSHDQIPRVDNNPRPVSGRVIVDAYAFYLRQGIHSPDLVRNAGRKPLAPNSTGPNFEQRNSQGPASEERKEELQPLTDLECILAVPRVRGFDLMTKEWCEFNINELQDPDWSDVAFDSLVLPEGDKEKELIMALTKRDRLRKGVFNDSVQHKDRGIIFLLCGPPGVGKTLTAEAVADKSKIPLYILSADDIGTSPERVEQALKNSFECCRLWDALLLIDEADVFLETRRSDHLNRNELVSIFLRQLELYQGLMFLTTNRMEAIDEAFKSRMDLILRYFPLDMSARRQVWENFLNLLGPGNHKISKTDLDELAETELNGREIKNLIKTAYVLPSQERPVEMSHLRIVLNIRKRLDNW